MTLRADASRAAPALPATPAAAARPSAAAAAFRVFLQQPAIPEYLVPFIAELQARLGERLHLAFARSHQGTASAPGFVQDCERRHDGRFRLLAVRDLPLRMSWFDTRFDTAPRRGDVVVLAGNPRIVSNFAWLARPGVGTVWWGQGWGAATTARSAKIRVRLSNLFDSRLFYDPEEAALIGRWARAPTGYIGNTIAYSDAAGLHLREAAGPRFCFIGRLTDKSGAARLPAIAAGLKQRFGEALRIGIVGDGPLMGELREGIRARGLEGSFRFHGAVFDRDEASRLLRDYAFLVYPGAIGLTTQHALSEGLPIVTHGELSRHMPEARLLAHGRNALLCEDTEQGYIDACTQAATMAPGDYRALQQRCLAIRDTHSIARMADAFLAACEHAHAAVAPAAPTHG